MNKLDQESLLASAKLVLEVESEAIAQAAKTLGSGFVQAIEILLACKGKIILTGLGKSGYVAQKIAAGAKSLEEALASKIAPIKQRAEAATDILDVTKKQLQTGEKRALSDAETLAQRDLEAKHAAEAEGDSGDLQPGPVAAHDLEAACAPNSHELTEAVARYLFKLMAFKDEFEVARLYTSEAFQRQLSETFEGDLRLELHLAPPIPLLQRKTDFGGSRKMTFGPWMFGVMKVLARLKWLRGSWIDITRFNNDRIVERRLLSEYEAMLDEFATSLTPENHATAVALARIPEKIRGFGHIKGRHVAAADSERTRLLAEYRQPATALKLAAE